MVKTLIPSVKRSPLIVEIVGPAGVGKTTFLRALSRQHENLRPIFGFQHIKHIPDFLRNAVLLLPVFLCRCNHRRRYTRKEMRWMIRLQASRQILQRKTLSRRPIIILDQGPIYTLTRLSDYRAESGKCQCFVKWWNRMLREWATTMDMVIWLDAPDEVLVERVYARSKWHAAKEQSNEGAKNLLAHYRILYEQTMAKLTTMGHPKVLCYDTSRDSLKQIVEQTSAAFNLSKH